MRKVPFRQSFSPLAGPLALVTTIDQAGHVNVAPKSWITHVCSQPNLLVLGCSRHHHTARNLLANGECVLNFPSDDLARLTWDAHRYLEPGPDEVALRGFTPLPAEQVAPPRLKECRAHIEGRVESVKWYGDECIFFVEEVARSIDKTAAAAPDLYTALRPIFYLGPSTYGVIERSHKLEVHGDGDNYVRYAILLTRRPDRELTEPLIRAHVAHLRQLDAAGRLILCGPFGDQHGGLIVIRADSLEEAQAIAAADPFVASGAEEFEVRSWHLSCEGNNHMGFGG